LSAQAFATKNQPFLFDFTGFLILDYTYKIAIKCFMLQFNYELLETYQNVRKVILNTSFGK
jgi:hypothetical protein